MGGDSLLIPNHIVVTVPKTHWLWGSSKEQSINEITTIHETNICNHKGAGLLILWRALCLVMMVALVHYDIKHKGMRIEKYTFWGEIATLVVFFLLTLCSLEKFAKQEET